MQINSALYENCKNGEFADRTWEDANGNTVIFLSDTAKLSGNAWKEYEGKILQSEYKGSGSITIYCNGNAIYQFSKSDIYEKPALLLTNNEVNPFFEK